MNTATTNHTQPESGHSPQHLALRMVLQRRQNRRTAHRHSRLQEAGYTLFEIMMVIAIIAILAGMTIFAISNVFGDVAQTEAKNTIRQMEEAIELYRINPRNRQYPTTEQGLEVLVPKYLDEVPKDPWGEEYKYLSPGRDNRAYDLYTLGADRQEGGEEENADITSWNRNN